MKKVILCLLSIMAVVSSILFVNVTYAYVRTTLGYYKQNVDMDGTTNVSSTYRTSVSAAASSWASAGSKRAVSLTTASINKVYTQSVLDTWYGVYRSLEQNVPAIQTANITTKFSIVINTSMAVDTLTARSAACHEMGHSVGLWENTPFNGPGTSIMDSTRSRMVTYSPQPDDISGVNKDY